MTTNYGSVNPVWGTAGIVFVRARKPPRRGDAFKQDIYVVDPATNPRRVTKTRRSRSC